MCSMALLSKMFVVSGCLFIEYLILSECCLLVVVRVVCSLLVVRFVRYCALFALDACSLLVVACCSVVGLCLFRCGVCRIWGCCPLLGVCYVLFVVCSCLFVAWPECMFIAGFVMFDVCCWLLLFVIRCGLLLVGRLLLIVLHRFLYVVYCLSMRILFVLRGLLSSLFMVVVCCFLFMVGGVLVGIYGLG